MDRFTAEKLIEEIMISYTALQQAESVANTIEEVEEKVTIMKGLMSAAGELEDGPILKIVRQYPDLNPFSNKST